ncbi:MAG: hypothetical protein CM15mP13_3440 [Pseudomonadota bacterium]|nr:MAG: hypothetical protein CM15mP13_3440 [Pseudomonadota bacterium]
MKAFEVPFHKGNIKEAKKYYEYFINPRFFMIMGVFQIMVILRDLEKLKAEFAIRKAIKLKHE